MPAIPATANERTNCLIRRIYKNSFQQPLNTRVFIPPKPAYRKLPPLITGAQQTIPRAGIFRLNIQMA
jgi:hypothetical protein